MSVEQHKQSIQRLNELVINGGQHHLIDEIYAADLQHIRRGLKTTFDVFSSIAPPATDTPPRERFKRGLTLIHSGFPDWHSRIDESVGEGDTLVNRYTVTGTHLKPFLGIPPTGRRIEIHEVVFFGFADGLVNRIWAIAGEADLWVQLGVIIARPDDQIHDRDDTATTARPIT